MNFSAILSFIVGSLLILYGIMDNGSISSFWDLGSVFITIGGTIAALCISYPFNDIKKIPSHIRTIIKPKKYKVEDYIKRLSDLALVARRDGILALESSLTENDDDFIKSSILLIVDSVEQSKVKKILDKQIEYITDRHEYASSIYVKAANYAPAFGMIGTVIGLINMLSSMSISGGADSLATGMALALITTFYGTVLANLVFLPIAYRLRALHSQEIFCKELVVEGVLAIQDGSNPKFVEDRLKSFASTKTKSNKSNKVKFRR